jgi:RNA polymerase sigma-70 factor, ECF subfamily
VHPTVSEAELAALRRGDERVTTTVWRRLNPALVRYLRSRGCADADDVASQVWLEVARGLARFEGDGDAFRRWLFTLAHRRLIDAGRRRGRRRDRPVASLPEAPVTDERPGGEPDELEAAIALVRRLPPAQADVVLLRVLGGFPVEDVARIVDRSPGAVRVLCHRGLTRLRDLVDAGSATLQTPGVTPHPAPTLTPTDD